MLYCLPIAVYVGPDELGVNWIPTNLSSCILFGLGRALKIVAVFEFVNNEFTMVARVGLAEALGKTAGGGSKSGTLDILDTLL